MVADFCLRAHSPALGHPSGALFGIARTVCEQLESDIDIFTKGRETLTDTADSAGCAVGNDRRLVKNAGGAKNAVEKLSTTARSRQSLQSWRMA
jgi:hypothetical protein